MGPHVIESVEYEWVYLTWHCATSGRSRVRFPLRNWGFCSQLHCGSVVDSASSRDEYQDYHVGDKGGRFLWPTNLPPSCAICLEILETSNFMNIKGLSRPVYGLPYPLFNGRWVMTDLVYIYHFSVRFILGNSWLGNGCFRYLVVSSYFNLLK